MKTKKVIYNDFFDAHKLKIAEHLQKKYNWEPILMFGKKPDMDSKVLINKKFPSCAIIGSLDMWQAQFDYSDIGQVKPLDEEILSSLSNHAFNYLSNLPDPTGNNFSYEERKSYYFDILKYWNTIIKNLNPDIFVSYIFPHTPSCLSLYLLCKHHYNIDTLFVNPFPMLNNNHRMISTSIEKMDETISKIYKSNENMNLGLDGIKYLDEIRRKDAKPPSHIIKVRKLLQQTSKIGNRIKTLLGIILKTLKNGYGLKIDNDWKKNNKPYYKINSRMNNFENFFFIEKLRHKNKRLKKIYDSYVTKADLTKKYIYFAAQYQPEATTSQIGSYYENFFLVLDILSAVIPDDWIIYYKENPTIFSNSVIAKGSLRRDKYYYEKLANYKNVKMISENTNTFDLIDNAQVVSTVTGTAAWEAVVRGVPSMTFGKTWYSGCSSIFFIKTFKDAENTIKKIINGYMPHQSDIERYTAAIEKVASKNIIPQNMFNIEIAKHENPEKILIKIADEFHDAHLDHYAN